MVWPLAASDPTHLQTEHSTGIVAFGVVKDTVVNKLQVMGKHSHRRWALSNRIFKSSTVVSRDFLEARDLSSSLVALIEALALVASSVGVVCSLHQRIGFHVNKSLFRQSTTTTLIEYSITVYKLLDGPLDWIGVFSDGDGTRNGVGSCMGPAGAAGGCSFGKLRVLCLVLHHWNLARLPPVDRKVLVQILRLGCFWSYLGHFLALRLLSLYQRLHLRVHGIKSGSSTKHLGELGIGPVTERVVLESVREALLGVMLQNEHVILLEQGKPQVELLSGRVGLSKLGEIVEVVVVQRTQCVDAVQDLGGRQPKAHKAFHYRYITWLMVG